MRWGQGKGTSGSDTQPDIYHKMDWQVDSKDPRGCVNHFSADETAGMLCVKPLLPTVTVPQFIIDEEENLEHYTNNQEKPTDYVPDAENYVKNFGREWGYQQFCFGDSGSGNWIVDPDNDKASLMGVLTTSFEFCSRQSVVTRTTLPSVLNWIKKHAGIKS